jgi:hypothetical protein
VRARAEPSIAMNGSREREIRMNSQADMSDDERHLMIRVTVGCRMRVICATTFSRPLIAIFITRCVDR